MNTDKLNNKQILEHYKKILSNLYGQQSSFSKKLEKNIKNIDYKFIVGILAKYIHKTEEQIKQYKRDNIYRAYTAMMLIFNEHHDSDTNLAGIGYNRVCTHLFNENTIINILLKYKSDKLYINDDGYICFGNNIVLSTYDKNKDVMSSDKIYDFLFKEYNNKLYMVIADDEITGELIETERFLNGFGGYSYMVPVNQISDLQTNHIKGKDWIKEYIYKPKIGYLYFLTMKINNTLTYKVGISQNMETRFNNYEKQFIIDNIVYKMNMLEAAILERYFHHKYYNLKDNSFINSEYDISGKTELYHENLHTKITPDLLDKALKQLDDENYPITSSMIREILNKQNNELNI